VREAAAAGELAPTTSIAVLGAAGAGKTHVFARLRRMLGGGASFVLVRPLLGVEPTLRLLLAEVLDQLRRPPFGGALPQLDALVGGALAAQGKFPSAGLTDVAMMDEDHRRARIEETLARLFALRPELEGAALYVERLLGFPLEPPAHRSAVAAWLSGRDLDSEAARAANLPPPLSEVDVLRALTALAALAARSAPLLIAFDQLENLADPSGDRARAHGNLVGELVDQMPALTLVQLALTGEWLQHIQPALSLPQRTRVADQSLFLEEPTAEDRRTLVRMWLEETNPSASVDEAELERWCREPGMTPRMLLHALRRTLESELPLVSPLGLEPEPPPTPAPESPAPPVEKPPRPRRKRSEVAHLDQILARAWKTSVRAARREIRETRGEERLLDVERIAEVLAVTLTGISSGDQTALVWRRSSGPSPYLIGTVAAGGARGNIVLVQGSHPRSIATALDRARDLTSEPLLFVRQGTFDFPPGWVEVAARVHELQRLTRTCWLTISDDVLAHGLAFAGLLAATRSGELTGPGGETVSPVALRAWSSAPLADSLDVLAAEVRAVLAGWAPLAPLVADALATAPAKASTTGSARARLASIFEAAAARVPFGPSSLEWLRAARARVGRRPRS
ncbi:MAG TPA: hypothetical protein VGI39_13075, partial [Polyangiaceae bacterium]|jgi:hypothetical protein